MSQRIGGEGVAGRVLLGGKMLGIACFKKKVHKLLLILQDPTQFSPFPGKPS